MTAAALTGTRWTDRMVVLWGITAVATVALFAVSWALGSALYGVPVPVALLFALVQSGALLLTLAAPRAGAAAAVAGAVGFAAVSSPASGAPWPFAVPSMIAFAFAVALAVARSSWIVGFVAWVAAVGGGIIVAILTLRPPQSTGAVTADVIVFAALSAAALLGGVLATRWQDVRRQLVRERQLTAAEQALREVAEERTRIARELHDVVAHGMSAIQVQASSARYRMPDLPADAAAEFDELAATARAAMGEMRSLLGVLRGGEAAETAPQPGIGDVSRLIDAARRRGEVTFADDLGEDDGMAADRLLGLAVYRIVQESLSNIARHATGAPSRVRLARLDGADGADGATLIIEVVNDRAAGRPASAPAPASGGHGIPGMRERAELLGGSLEAGPRPDGGFTVLARLPLQRTGRDRAE
ncbi:sensor histidine kinase [Leifsonia sp. SIMBA_070]|uniref:sensor histidine kinase n=1 Tax=Leifsonia sp. SIMBA_070 TaxID=3085810 RepID=UPI00397D2DE6